MTLRRGTTATGARLTAVAALLFCSAARGADLTVTAAVDAVNGNVSSPAALQASPGPDGISLREAILAANNAVGPHTVTFDPSLVGQTIALTSRLDVTRDEIAILGIPAPDGRPGVTLDGAGFTAGLCCRSLLTVVASDFTLLGVRMTGVTNHAIRVMAGRTLFPPSAPQLVRNILIHGNVFDNTGAPVGDRVNAIRIWHDPEATAADATIANVTVSRNTFLGYTDTNVIFVSSGTNCAILDVSVEENLFDGVFPIELVTTTGPGNRISGARIVRNVLRNATVSIFIANSEDSSTRPPSAGNIIENTLIWGNTISTDFDSISVVGGQGNASRNTVRDVRIVNNSIIAGRGIDVVGGQRGATGNRVEDVAIVNNSVTSHPLAAVRVTANRDDGADNSVAGVLIRNSIIWRRVDAPRAEPEIFGEVTVDQVQHCLTSAADFAGVNGNISADPRFLDRAQGDLRLTAGSPAIDAGTSDGASETDLECRVRFDDPATPNVGGGAIPYFDIGAFEFGAPPASCERPRSSAPRRPPRLVGFRPP